MIPGYNANQPAVRVSERDEGLFAVGAVGCSRPVTCIRGSLHPGKRPRPK